VCRLLVTASVVPSSQSLVTLMKEALRFSETLVLTRARQRNISKDAILHSHRCENLKSCILRHTYQFIIDGAYLKNKETKTNSVAFSPEANYSDRSTGHCWRSLVPTFADRGASRSQRGGTFKAVNLSFLDQSRYVFFQVAPHLCSRV
jgi:hypothetical protein